MKAETKPANPEVRFPPPFIFLLGLGAAWFLETRAQRIAIFHEPRATDIAQTVGVVLLIVGLVVMFWGMLTFAQSKTAILPMRPASRIVVHGPYRFTRNPMYVGMALAYLGGAIGMNSFWALILFPFVIVTLIHLVIRKEERYLLNAFGSDYDRYRRRVRRWL